MKQPVVTVVIPTLQEAAGIADLLDDVRAQTLQPAEVLVVDGYSADGTAGIARAHPVGARVLQHGPHVAKQRNMGGYSASGDIIVFLDADTRLQSQFLEKAIGEFERRGLDVACPWYVPHRSTLSIHAVYALFNTTFYALQKVLASGAGSCIIMRRSLLHASRGFDPSVTFDDIDLIRHTSWSGRFGILHTTVRVSDRRFRKYGVVRMTAVYVLLSIFFAVGAFRAANVVTYEFGKYGKDRSAEADS